MYRHRGIIDRNRPAGGGDYRQFGPSSAVRSLTLMVHPEPYPSGTVSS
jgi:hypothetical protein